MKKIECISPIDGSIYAQRNLSTLSEAEKSISRGKSAQIRWKEKSLKERIELVKAGVAKIGQLNYDIIPELAWQMGRPIRYGGEFSGFNERASHMAAIAEDALADIKIEDKKNFRRVIKRVPHGIVLVIAPWNYPYMTAINSIAPALIAGNAVVLKHASQTPLVGERISNAFHAAGVPEDIFQNLFLNHETTTKLIQSSRFDFINFTGSVSGGRSIESAASGTFTGLGLELGGKDPGYVMVTMKIIISFKHLKKKK